MKYKHKVTPKQDRIIKLLAEGHSLVEIAKELKLSNGNIKVELEKVYALYKISDRYSKKTRLIYLLWKDNTIKSIET